MIVWAVFIYDNEGGLIALFSSEENAIAFIDTKHDQNGYVIDEIVLDAALTTENVGKKGWSVFLDRDGVLYHVETNDNIWSTEVFEVWKNVLDYSEGKGYRFNLWARSQEDAIAQATKAYQDNSVIMFDFPSLRGVDKGSEP